MSTAKHQDPGAAEGGLPAWIIAAVVAVLVVLLLVFLVVTRRIGGRRQEDFVEMEPEDEGTGEEPPDDEEDTGVVDDLEDLIAEVEGGTDQEAPEETEEVHVVEPPIGGPAKGEATGEVDFKDLPRSPSRKQPEPPVEREVDAKDLSSVDADAEVEDSGESEDTQI